MRCWTVLAVALPLALAGCGGDAEAPRNSAEPAPDATGSEAEVAADAALADQAAQAEAADAAYGGNLSGDDVSAANNAAANGQ